MAVTTTRMLQRPHRSVAPDGGLAIELLVFREPTLLMMLSDKFPAAPGAVFPPATRSPTEEPKASPRARRWLLWPVCLLALAGTVAPPLGASEITPGPTPGARVYSEDFTDPGAVDSAAGVGPGLDQTEINGSDQLVQVTTTTGTFVTDFDAAGLYTFDPGRIQVSGGLASLGDTIIGDLAGYWRFEEASWSGVAGEVLDTSGNGHHGVAGGDADTFAPGQIGRAAGFDGDGDLVNIGQPSNLDFDPAADEFTLAAWFRTTTQGAILGKAADAIAERQYYLFVIGGRLWGAMGGEQNFGNSGGLTDGQWHHGAIVNFDDGGTMRYTLYVDGVADGTFTSGTTLNSADLMIGARRVSGNSGVGFPMDGDIDEALIVDRALSAAEVAGLYNGGNGRVLQEFPADEPPIFKTAGDTANGLTDFTFFSETLGPGNEGSVAYQLSTDGVAWRFWNGAAWVPASSSQHNTAAVVDANIAAFDTSAEAIFVRAFLLSDGSQRVELDRLEVGYERNFSALFTVPFEVAANYTFDAADVRLADGVAKLDAEPPFWNDLLGYWRMEEGAWGGVADEVRDVSSFGYHGTAVGDANTVAAGKIGRGGSFDGLGDAVLVRQRDRLSLDPQAQEFTVTAWFRTASQGAIVSKAVANFGSRQYYLFTADGRLWAAVGGNQNFGPSTGVDDGQWHHGVLVNFNDAGTMRNRLYLDGALEGEFLSGTILNTADVIIGGRRVNGNSGLGFLMDGEIDEVAILGRALTPGEVAQLYNAGAGSVRTFPDTGPSVFETAGDSDPSLSAFTAFLENPGLGHQGDLAYQLSVDGATWQYWDGANWTPAVLDSQRNDAATVDANIATFDASAEQLFVRAFLLSDGIAGAEVDSLVIRYDTDQGFAAFEILGPINAGYQFDTFTAQVADQDAEHRVTFQFLDSDAASLISDAQLPGNSAGFDSTEAASGVDLSAVFGGAIYLRVRFGNVFADMSSAALDAFQISYLDFNDQSDLSVSKSAMPDPVIFGEPITYDILLNNAGPSVGFSTSLDDTLPAGTTFVSLARPSGWSCLTPVVGSSGTVSCSHPEAPVGGPFLFRLVVQVPLAYGGPLPIDNTVVVSAASDPDPMNNSASASVEGQAPAPGTITVVKDADPAQGRDFAFDGDLGPFLLDDAVPDDGDGVGDTAWFPGLTLGSYEVSETLPPGWQILDIACNSSVVPLRFLTPYSVPGNYSFAADKIEVADGVARLRGDSIIPSGYWRFEEAGWSGAPQEVLDSSGNGHHGVALGDATTQTMGLIERGGVFDGSGDAVNLGQPAALDFDPANDEFTLATWFRTSGDGALIAKADGSFPDRQFYLFVFDDRLWASIGGNINAGGAIDVADGQWHHGAVVNFDDGGIMRYVLYFDGQNIGFFNSGTATNGDDVLFGARREVGNSGLTFGLSGEMDEVMMVPRALSETEMLGLYNAGAGRVVGELPDNGPSIVKTLGDGDQQIDSFTGFTALTGPDHQGTIRYQLSTDGSDWRYWDGAAWSMAGPGEDNDAATVDANIGLFDTGSNRIFVRLFLLSDGSQQVEIDRLEISYMGTGLVGTSFDDDSAFIELLPAQDISCTFSNVADPTQFGSITVVKEATPADGTDFSFSGDLASFVLDDADPDDGDGVPQSQTFSELLPASYSLTEAALAGWNFSDFNCDAGLASDSFEYPFTFGASYSFDATKIALASGRATLLPDAVTASLKGYWRFEEASWDGTPGEVLDGSGQGLHGTAIGDANTFSFGQIGRSGLFDGDGDAITLGQPSALDLNPAVDEFSVTAWFRTSSSAAIVSKADSDFGQRQYYLFAHQNRLWANIGGSQNQGSELGALDGDWHHGAVVNSNDGGTFRYTIYLDGVDNGTFLSGAATNGSDVLIGARRNVGNSGTAFHMIGSLDEVAIIDRALTPQEVAELFNGGSGRELRQYPANGPTVVKTAGDGGVDLVGLTGFAVTYGPGNVGTAEFQLSDNGSDWQYWDGVAWSAADDSQRNDAATVDANVAAFDVSADQIFLRTFLLSDGDQPVVVDNISLSFDKLTTVPDFEVVGQTVTLELDPGDDVICTFVNVDDGAATGSIELLLRSDPADGADVDFSGDLGVFSLDDALVDDGDGLSDSILVDNLAAGSYSVAAVLPADRTIIDLECTSGDGADSTALVGDSVVFDLDAGESLSCTLFEMERFGQITETTGAFQDNYHVAINDNGRLLSFVSNRDLAGGNGDASDEIFAYGREGFAQLTSALAPADHATRPRLSSEGRFVVFASTANLTGGNVDENREIYRYDRQTTNLLQVTQTVGCDNRRPVVNVGGGVIALVTTCADLDGPFNGDGNPELVVWQGGNWHLTETTACGSFEPAISADGARVAFHSDCDAPYGTGNGDGNSEIYQWRWGLGASGYRQVTNTSAAAPEINESVASSANGRYLAFSSNADLAASNGDGSLEIFRWDRLTDSFDQLTDAGPLVAQTHTALDALGRHLAYERLDFSGSLVSALWHSDGQTAVDTEVAADIAYDSEFPAVAITGNGKAVVVFQSAADFLATNGDGNVEIWRRVIVPAATLQGGGDSAPGGGPHPGRKDTSTP